MSNKNEVINYNIVLSDILNLAEKHQDAYLCSTQDIWNDKCLKDEAIIGLPRNFRVIQNNIKQFSASGIFTKLQLKNAVRYIKDINSEIRHIHVIDLMKEYHGFIEYNQNAIPFSWRANYNTVNFGVHYNDVAQYELEVIQKMRSKFNNKNLYIISCFSSTDGILDKIHKHVKITKYKNIITEEDLCLNNGIVYHRLSSVDYNPPQYQAVIDLATFTQNEFNPKTDWIHIHCHGGQGRSTSFSILFDMFMRLENSTLGSISFPELLQFHSESSGKNLLAKPIDGWKYGMAIARRNMLNQAYNFLIEINNSGLKDVYSVALKIYFLHQTNGINDTTFNDIISDSGSVIQEKIYSDRKLEDKLYNFYLTPEILDLTSNNPANSHSL